MRVTDSNRIVWREVFPGAIAMLNGRADASPIPKGTVIAGWNGCVSKFSQSRSAFWNGTKNQGGWKFAPAKKSLISIACTG